jgi:hypothetical protein
LSIRDDIEIVKEGLTTEEQFLTSFIKTEKFVKKYKTLIIGCVIAILFGVAGYEGYGFYNEKRIEMANEALSKLLKNPSDKDATEQLRSKSQKLYEAYLYLGAIQKDDQAALKKSSSTTGLLGDLASYQLASISVDETALKAYALNKESVMKDFANYLLAYKSVEKSDTKMAKEYLAKIPASSNIKEQANYLEHLLIKAQKPN